LVGEEIPHPKVTKLRVGSSDASGNGRCGTSMDELLE
jgi:hypothetical protein